MTKDYQLKIKYLDNPILSLEIFNTLLGDFIGSGCSREVYEYAPDKKCVIKIENGGGSGDNFAEYNIWNSVKYTKNAKFFAPCEWISPNGMILIQRKTQPFYSRKNSLVPDKIPAMFTDLHEKNFGWIGKQFVAHDYAFCLGMSASACSAGNRMQSTKNKLKWDYDKDEKQNKPV